MRPSFAGGVSPRRRRAILGVAVGVLALDTALIGLIAPLLPDIEQRTGASEGALGVALAAEALPILMLSLPLGRAAYIAGRRVLLIVGVVLIAAGSVLIAVTESLEVLVAGRVVQGIGSASSWVAALTMFSDLAPPGRRGESIGFALSAVAGGSIAGPALGGVTADALSYAAPFLIVCGISVVFAAVAAAIVPNEGPHEPPATPAWRSITRSAGSGVGAIATAIMFAGSCGLGFVELVAPLDLDARLGLSSSTIGLLFAGSIAIDAVLAPLGGRWGDRRGRRAPAVAGLTGVATSLVLLAVLGGTLGAAVALVVFGAGSSLAFAAAVPWLDEAFGAVERGLGYGMVNVLYAAGYTAGPVIGGLLVGLGGADLAYGLLAAAFAVGAVALAALTTAATVGSRRRTTP